MLLRTVLLMLFLVSALFAQKGVITGKVLDGDGKAVLYATLRIKELKYVAASDAEGKFAMGALPYGKYSLIVSHVGYATTEKTVTLDKKKTDVRIVLRKTPVTLGEAVVIGARTLEAERNFSLPVEELDAKVFEEKIPNSVADAFQSKAGVDVARDGAWGTMINVRGLSKQNLVYLIDGARVETSTNIAGGLSLFDLNDIEKAEVIKGGLSSLYGTGATGGAVNIITKKANFSRTPYLRGYFSGGYQTVNRGYAGGVNLFAGSQNWKAKFSASARKGDDVKIPDGYLINSGFKDYAYSASIGYLPLENLEVNAEYQKYKATDVGIPGGAAFPPSAMATYPEASRELFAANLIWRNPARFLNLLSLRYYNQWIRREVEIVPAPGKSVKPSSDHRTNGVTLQSESVFGSHYLIAGIDAWARSYKGIRVTRNDAADVTIFDKPVPDSKFSSLGFFATDDFTISQKLKITFGGRYDFIGIENDATNNPLYKIVAGDTLYPAPNPAASFPAEKNDNRSWSGNVNLLYKLSGNADVSFSAAKTFRSPSLEERYQYINLGGIIYLGNPKLEPEKGVSLNFGTRYYGEKFSLKANLFANYFNDLVIDAAEVPESLYVKRNVGKSRFYGFDLTFQTKICKSLFTGTLAYVNARDTETDTPLPQIPPLNGSLEITAPVLNLFDFTVRGTFYADQNDVPPDEARTPGYAVYDLELKFHGLNFGGADLKLYGGVNNIFNRKYRNHLSTYRGVSLTEPGINFYLKFAITFNGTVL